MFGLGWSFQNLTANSAQMRKFVEQLRLRRGNIDCICELVRIPISIGFELVQMFLWARAGEHSLV